MQQTTCTNCNGTGLVGQGDEPWMHRGTLETCKKCSGTGKVDETSAEPAPAEDASVDNPTPEKGGIGGIIRSILG